MATSLADTYYLKAAASYEWDAEETLEALNYALSYDANHPLANCLMGKLLAEKLGRTKEAEEHFHTALAENPESVCAYENLAELHIRAGDFEKARTVLKHAEALKTANPAGILQKKALLAEAEGKPKKAEKFLQKAMAVSLNSEQSEQLHREMQRVEAKCKSLKKKGKQKKKKAK